MTDASLTAAQLVTMAGEALFGERWVAELARALNVQTRTVERVAKAVREGQDYPAARAWLADLHVLLADRQRDVTACQAALAAYHRASAA